MEFGEIIEKFDSKYVKLTFSSGNKEVKSISHMVKKLSPITSKIVELNLWLNKFPELNAEAFKNLFKFLLKNCTNLESFGVSLINHKDFNDRWCNYIKR